MAIKFLSVVTDEAMQKICYEGGGWDLNPYRFAISETDYLDGIIELDAEGNVTNEDECLEKLCSLSTDDMMKDINKASTVWCNMPFSTVSKANNNSLNHHIVIPPDLDVTSNKAIKTIYFIYQAHNGETFLYGLAYAVGSRIYELGITQSMYFTFTVSNARYVDNVTYTVNYTYPQEIEDHNNTEDVHTNLVKRDGSRTITGTLMYSGSREYSNNYQLVSKEYVDKLIAKLKSDNNLK